MLQRVIVAGLAFAATIATFAFALPVPAAADDYPSRPITMIVPYPAGGGVDFMGRLVAQYLSTRSASRSSSRTAVAPAA